MESYISAKREDNQQSLPSKIAPINIEDLYTKVSPDNLTVRFTYDGGDGAGLFQSDNPAPTNRSVYYFEVFVRNAGVRGGIAVGFSSLASLDRILTCSYRGNNGLVYRENGEGEFFEETWDTYTTDDTVGCGIDYVSQDFFFTKNGLLVGTVPNFFTGFLYPTIGLHSQNEEVTANFGPEGFLFDPQGRKAATKERKNVEIEKIPVPPGISHKFVKKYLIHCGYAKTLEAFCLATASPPGIEEQELSSLHDRKKIIEHIMAGEIDAALAQIKDSYPKLVEKYDGEVNFLLVCQKIAELVRKRDENAAEYGTVELFNFNEFAIGLEPDESALLREIKKDCKTLLSCENPEESGVSYLLEETQREVVADAVNEMVLDLTPNSQQLQFSLDLLLRQLSVCNHYCRR